MEATVYPYKNIWPTIDADTMIAPGAKVIGRVTLKKGVSIWHNAVLRGDVHDIVIGEYSNIQDNSTVHCDSGISGLSPTGLPTIVGKNVTVGHNCVLHACTIEDDCLIGMSATILDGAVIGRGSVIGAGALVTKGTVIPPFSLVVGVPGKVVKTLPEEATLRQKQFQTEHYYGLSQAYKQD